MTTSPPEPAHRGGVPAAAPASLRNRLLRHVIWPLAMTWAVGTGVALGVSQHFAGQAFDRALLDDAYLVASRVVERDGRLALTLSNADLGTVLFDQSESEFFAVHRGADGSLLAGHPGLHALAPGAGAAGGVQFGEQGLAGRSVRVVTLHRDEPLPFSVTMAQTTAARTRLLHRLLLTSVAPQLLLLLALAWWLRRAIHADLLPIAQLQQAVEQRDVDDLTPLGAALADAAPSRDVQRLGRSINALLGRLGDSLRAQREFSGNVAHELRTPLAGIRALAEYGLAQTQPAVWREQLEAVVRNETRASHLIDQLLALALADEARAGLTLMPVPLHDVVRETVLRHLPRADAAGVDLGADGLDAPCQVLGSRPLLEGLLDNLIDNALRYGRAAPPSRSTLTVVIERRQDGTRRVSVIDNGRGVDADEAARLHGRWARGRDALGRGGGAGLGLAIVSRYAALMSARFDLGDAPGGGLRASVTFDGEGGPGAAAGPSGAG